jgi:hypothetical protein
MYSQKKKEMLSKEELLDTISKICYYAQSHSSDEEAWGERKTSELKYMLEHTSYVVACFIAQNTDYGGAGVEFDIVLNELAGKVRKLNKWRKILKEKLKTYYI